MTPSLRSLALPLVALALACSADAPVDRNKQIDAGTGGDVLAPPKLDPTPERTPLASVAVRGTTGGARVVSLGPFGTKITAVLPGGTFCQDAAIETGGAESRLEFFSVGGDGRLSNPAIVEVVHDPAAPQPAMRSCGGDDPTTACAGPEVCGTDGKDEDCDGWADACDTDCSGCVDDAFEPNDLAVNVPSIQPGTYDDMVICPCRDDWFAFFVSPGQRIRPTINFTTALIDLDMRLFWVNPDGSGTGTQVASSVTTTNQETIDYLVPAGAGGTYYLRIYPFKQDDKPQGTYQLIIR
jgi:hypothetical protein